MTKFDFLRPLTDEEYARTKKSIADSGQHFPIIRDQNGVTLDGHHRERMLTELGVPKDKWKVEKRDFADDDARRLFVIEANNDRRQSDTAEDNKRTAVYLYDGGNGWTMQRIADVLGVSKVMVSKYLADIVNQVNNVKPDRGTDTLGRKKSPGRPKGPPKPPKEKKVRTGPKPERHKFDQTQEQLAATKVLDEGKTRAQAAAEAGVTEKVVQFAVEREQGRREAKADPEIDVATFSLSQKEKFDTAVRQYRRKLDLEYDQRRTNEIREHLDGYLLPLYRTKLAEAEAVLKSRKGIMSLKDWELVRNCLHPDNSASTEKRQRAFNLWNEEKLKLVILAEKDNQTGKAPPLPKTAAEWMARKAQVDAERKAARAAKKGGSAPAERAR